MKMEKLVRKEVLELSPYEVKSPRKLISPENVIKLDLNENFAVEADVTKKLLLDIAQDVDVRSYPAPYGSMAIKAISEFLRFSESEIAVGNGADEVLDLLMKIFIKTDSKVLIVEPTFSMYRYFTELYGGKTVAVPLRPNFELDIAGVLEKIDEGISLVMLCSPNNPTGNQFRERDVKQILQEFNGPVIVDESYIDFAPQSFVEWVRQFDNFVILRTFSKAFGLAGIRFGFLVSNRSIVKYVKRVTSPFNVNVVAQRVIALALKHWNYFKERIRYVTEEREWVRSNLNSIDGITPYPSHANFVLFKIAIANLSSSAVASKLEGKGILVKDLGALPLLSNCIRVTVGTHHMNNVFCMALRDILENT